MSGRKRHPDEQQATGRFRNVKSKPVQCGFPGAEGENPDVKDEELQEITDSTAMPCQPGGQPSLHVQLFHFPFNLASCLEKMRQRKSTGVL